MGASFSQCLLFHRKIGLERHVGCFDTFVTEPQRHRGDLHPSLQQMHGGRVANDMRRDVFRREAGAGRDGALDGLLSQIVHAIT